MFPALMIGLLLLAFFSTCRALQLRALAAALRKQDDVNGVLEALGRVEMLIRGAPDELASAAPVGATKLQASLRPVTDAPVNVF